MQIAVVLFTIVFVLSLPFVVSACAPLTGPGGDGQVLTNVLDLSPTVAEVGTERLEIAHETLRAQGVAAAQIEQQRIDARTQGVTTGLYAAAVALVAFFTQMGVSAWARAWASRPPPSAPAPPPPPQIILAYAGFLQAKGHDVDVELEPEGDEWVIFDHTRRLTVDAEAEEIAVWRPL